jgi:coiled-coil and C2 domain-containing protein 2A
LTICLACEQFDTNEDEKLMQYAERWQDELTKMHPKRHYKTSVIDVNGKNVFLTRYFKALGLKPPPDIEEKPDNMKAVSFVWLVITVESVLKSFL